jgi:hypothetical protein
MGPNVIPNWERFFEGAGPLFLLIWLAIGLLSVILSIIVWWRILAKTGYSGALGLLMFVPFANFILLLVLAFGTWPIETEVRRLRGGQ